jgi:hypothetical protein
MVTRKMILVKYFLNLFIQGAFCSAIVWAGMYIAQSNFHDALSRNMVVLVGMTAAVITDVFGLLVAAVCHKQDVTVKAAIWEYLSDTDIL